NLFSVNNNNCNSNNTRVSNIVVIKNITNNGRIDGSMKYDSQIKNRVKRIEGQVRGLLKMMEEEKECRDVVTQLSAVRSAIDRTSALIVSKNLEQCIRDEKETGESSEDIIKEAVNLLVKSRSYREGFFILDFMKNNKIYELGENHMNKTDRNKLMCREDILSITKKLVGIESIVNTDGEQDIATFIYNHLAAHPYFAENRSQLVMEQTINDERKRYNVLAYVKGTKGVSNRPVVLTGYMDTVGVDDFNKQRELAFSPEDWMKFLQDEKITEQAKEHLDSGDWLFGRGVLDMKSGLATNMYLLTYYAEHPELLDGNLVFIAECDEEDSSHGILSALKTLKKWKKEQGFEYVAAINSDFVAPAYEGDENRYVYKGTVGKLLPSFFITSEETHVGSAFDGLDPNFIAAELTKQINYNPELSDTALGEST